MGSRLLQSAESPLSHPESEILNLYVPSWNKHGTHSPLGNQNHQANASKRGLIGSICLCLRCDHVWSNGVSLGKVGQSAKSETMAFFSIPLWGLHCQRPSSSHFWLATYSIKTTMRKQLTAGWSATTEKWKISKVIEKGTIAFIISTGILENSREVPQNTEIRITMQSSNSTPRCTPKGTEISMSPDACTATFTAALFTAAKMWKPLKCPLVYKWTFPVWYQHNGIQLKP